MSFKSHSLKLTRLALLALTLLMITTGVTFGQFYDLDVWVGDTVGYPGQLNSVVSVYMNNWADTVAGYELWLFLERPDIMEFKVNYTTLYDTIYWRCTNWSGPDCLDSMDISDSVLADPEGDYPYDWLTIEQYQAYVGNHDTTGTLTSGWEFISSRSLGADTSGAGYDLKVIARSNEIPPPYTPGIPYPQTGSVPLVKILADIYDIPDSVSDRECIIYIQSSTLDHFYFADQNGNGIGVITDTIFDSTCFVCIQWDGDECVYYEDTSDCSIADSVECCDTILNGYLDTSVVSVDHGSLTVLGGVCGSVNGDESVNLLDITYLINFLYKGGPPPPNMNLSDANGDCNVNLLDITFLINYLYKAGLAPHCDC